MKCEDCKKEVKESFRVWNWEYENMDQFYDTYEKAKEAYEVALKEELLQWRLYHHAWCDECEWDNEDCLEGQLLY